MRKSILPSILIPVKVPELKKDRKRKDITKRYQKRDITKENQLDTDGICYFVVCKSNLYQDSRVTTCFINGGN